jgi:hypothetical protein
LYVFLLKNNNNFLATTWPGRGKGAFLMVLVTC